MNALLRDLRRRRLAQWTLGFLAGAWVFLQVLDLFADNFGWPAVVEQVATVLLAGVALAVLVLAWFHGERGPQRARAVEIILLATLMISTAGVATWVIRSARGEATSPEPLRGARPIERGSIAVLPFTPIGSASDEYFADGLTEDVLDALSRVPGLRVVARTSAFRFRGEEIAADSAGRALNVAHVLRATVRVQDPRVRVVARLVSTETGYQVWSETYESELTDVLRVQEDLSQAIAQELRLRLPELTQGGASANPEALALYARGRHAWNRRLESSLRAAIGYFEEAVARDPGLARAWAALGQTYVIMPEYAQEPNAVWFERARTASERALAHDSSLSDAHATMAFILSREWRTEEAEEAFARAFELNPNDATAHHWYALHLASRGRYPEAHRALQRAAVLDPLAPVITLNLGISLYQLERLDESIRSLRELTRVEPAFGVGHAHLARSLAAAGRNEEAVAAARRAQAILGDEGHSRALLSIGYALARAGATGEAEAVLRELERRTEAGSLNPGGYGPAVVHAALGNLDAAIEWLERGVTERHYYARPDLIEFAPLRSHPRFAALLVGAPADRARP